MFWSDFSTLRCASTCSVHKHSKRSLLWSNYRTGGMWNGNLSTKVQETIMQLFTPQTAAVLWRTIKDEYNSVSTSSASEIFGSSFSVPLSRTSHLGSLAWHPSQCLYAQTRFLQQLWASVTVIRFSFLQLAYGCTAHFLSGCMAGIWWVVKEDRMIRIILFDFSRFVGYSYSILSGQAVCDHYVTRVVAKHLTLACWAWMQLYLQLPSGVSVAGLSARLCLGWEYVGSSCS